MPAIAAFPAMAAIIAISPGFLSGLSIGRDSPLATWAMWCAALYAATLLFALALCVMVALPGIIICRRLNWEPSWIATLAGALAGWLGLAMVSKALFKSTVPLYRQFDLLDHPEEAALLLAALAVGAAAGLTYWRIVHAPAR